MNAYRLLAFILMSAPFSPALAFPELLIVPGGIQDGNFVWRVELAPDIALSGSAGGTPLAFELGFRLTGAPLLGATNINPSDFSLENPGVQIFDWEDTGGSGFPEGLQFNLATGEIFAAFGSSGSFTTPDAVPFLEVVAQGPANGGEPFSTIEWLGAYGGNGRIAQLTGPTTSQNYDLYAGTATQVIPEPANIALVVLGAAALIACGRAAR